MRAKQRREAIRVAGANGADHLPGERVFVIEARNHACLQVALMRPL